MVTKKPGRKPATVDRFRAYRDDDAAHKQAMRGQARDVAADLTIADHARRAAATAGFRAFCESYFPEQFVLAWSADHLKILAHLDRAATDGGLFAFAMPRGSGKTTICECGALWAILTGRRRFCVLIGASEKHATEIIESVKGELETNDLLAADFPEALACIAALDGIAHRANGQLWNGERTHIGWTADELILPTIAIPAWPQLADHAPYVDAQGHPKCAGAIVRVAGITGRIRGMKFKRADGAAVRPDFVLLDDPQTDEALDIDTPIPTPSGFVRMGDLQVGDTVFNEAGRPCRIDAVSPVMYNKECHRVSFDDGSEVIADAGHKWNTSTALQRTNQRRKIANPDPASATKRQCQARPFETTRTTAEIKATISGEGGRRNHSIPLAGALEIQKSQLPIPPYTLGAWLGDGASADGKITTADAGILERIKEDGFSVSRGCASWYKAGNRPGLAKTHGIYGLRTMLIKERLLNNKHLPAAYRFAPEADRRAVLQGLMDTDGSISTGTTGIKGTRCVFSNTNYKLIQATVHLCRSLGIKARVSSIRQIHKNAAPGWLVTFITSIHVFHLERKRARLPAETKLTTRRRYITSVEPVESRPVRCISIDSPSHLYLCGHGMIPTHNSAKSPSQCEYREGVLAGAILGLAGRGKRIAGVMPCTVIRPGDMADRILDRSAHPDWNGERTKMVYAWPKREDLWHRYAEIRGDGLRAGDDGKAATEFYRENRAAMDEGCVVAWPECFQSNELSAIQNAMNLRLTLGDPAFFAEYQNEPMEDETVSAGSDITTEGVAQRVNGLQRFHVPTNAHRITAFIDVQGKALYYVVCAWEDDFTGAVIDYGSWPDQRRAYYTLRDIRITLASVIRDGAGKAAGQEGQIQGGLTRLVDQLVSTKWARDDGSMAHVNRILVDANWGESTEVVYEFCRRSPHAAILYPSHGKFFGASSRPLGEWQRRRGDRVGYHWKIPVAQGRIMRHVIIDTNFWKSFALSRLTTAPGDPGALTIYGDNPAAHRLLAEHVCSEYRIPVEGRGRKVDEWKWRPERFDNHWWDCIAGCAVAASIEGVEIGAGDGQAKRTRIRLSDLRNAKSVKPEAVRTEPEPEAKPAAPEAGPTPGPTPAPRAAPSRPGRIKLSDLRRARLGR